MRSQGASITRIDKGALLYADGGCGGACVLSYPAGKLVGVIKGLGLGGVCADGSGDVFLTYDATVFEFAHGGFSPIATLSLPGVQASGCSVDPTTGNLAVVFRGSGVDVAVFTDAKGTPATYYSQLSSSAYCGYDNSGDLFVDGYDQQFAGFSVMPFDGNEFSKLSISKYTPLPPGQVQWDGQYITYESTGRADTTVSRLQVTDSAVTVVGTTHFNLKHRSEASWIYGDRIFIPYDVRGFSGGREIGVWKYPGGGTQTQLIKNFGSYKQGLDLQGVAVSIGG
jgi:hypothetical protein